jgi:ABC-type multidrug transport system fused ATPase/permease subunit
MKKYLVLIAILSLCFRAESANIPSSPASLQLLTNPVNPLQYFSTLSMKEVQKLAGRKLKLKEKIAVKVFQWKIKKELLRKQHDDYENKGKTAMVFGIVAISSFLLTLFVSFGFLAAIAFSIAAIITGNRALKANPKDSNAKTGVTLGWITAGLLLLLTLFIIAFLATWAWGFG